MGEAARPPSASAAAKTSNSSGVRGDGVDQGGDAAVLELAGLGNDVAVARDHVVDAEVDQEALVLGRPGAMMWAPARFAS